MVLDSLDDSRAVLIRGERRNGIDARGCPKPCVSWFLRVYLLKETHVASGIDFGVFAEGQRPQTIAGFQDTTRGA